MAGFNLAAADYRRTRRQGFLAAGVVSLLSLVLVGQIVLWVAMRREGGGIGERLARMEQEFRHHQDGVRAIRAGIPAEAVKQYEAKVAVYNQILEASAFSWTGLLVELERSVPPGVSLSEIAPDLATGQVSLQGVARSFDDLSLFLRSLEERTAFRNVYLLRQAERKAPAGGQDGLEFGVNLQYRGRRR